MRRIVVGARPQGEEPWVLKAAAELAHQTGAELVVISVDELETEKLSTVPRSEVTARAERAAAEAVERLREAGIEASMEVRAGRPFEQNIGFADEQDADLIVVGKTRATRANACKEPETVIPESSAAQRIHRQAALPTGYPAAEARGRSNAARV
jgi:nucleotide-binding universal stress UspA family protein